MSCNSQVSKNDQNDKNNKNKESSITEYLDVNNLYGWEMSQKLPCLYKIIKTNIRSWNNIKESS